MKKKIRIQYDAGRTEEREINYIPLRYILALLFAVLETAAVILAVIMTLPGNYDKILKGFGIDAVPFSKLKGNADSEFNNRSHRKITVIDGRIGYTGGVNIADEYNNEKAAYGHWKDVGLRLEGEAVRELTRLFLVDYGINVRKLPEAKQDYFPEYSVPSNGYLIPFDDGPKPIYERRVGKTVIENMLNHATRYFYAMTPYLILDEALCQAVENAALRGVQVRLILPGVPFQKQNLNFLE